ncbi:MAG: phytanoyl-CoA dioxygenase family protein, partial [Bacteroidetes bacterium]|nr:phytanoyl-CoA dioxygenase family protein [Bacteroidota bacterium]
NELPDYVKRIISDLRKNGIAFSHVEELVQNKNLLNELEETVFKYEKENSANIDAKRQNSNDISNLGSKTFMHFLLGETPTYDAKSVFARFANQDVIRKISEEYLRMKTEMRYYNVWHTLPTTTEARESQLWHRDREDLQMMKMFVYFNDVDEGAGPFNYAPGTHILGATQTEPEYSLENGTKRTNDSQMDKVVSKSKWVTALGNKGTIIFADTHGFHKGGLARTSDRLLYTCMYVSPACERFYFKK